MATQKQIEVNRRNAQKSTGPGAEAGKESSRMNALEHGLASVWTVLPQEDGAYHELRAALVECWQPADLAELCLVDQIAQNYWRIQRNRPPEVAMLNTQVSNLKDRNAIVVAMTGKENERAHRIMERYHRRAESAYYRAIDRLRRLQRDRKRKLRQVEKVIENTHPASIASPSLEPRRCDRKSTSHSPQTPPRTAR